MHSFKAHQQGVTYIRTYSRWLEDKGRRETWNETVDRYRDFMIKRVPASKQGEFRRVCEGIKALDVMPSMRALWSAGLPLERGDHLAAYNCSYLEITTPNSFSDILYILMHGTGVGFSVERRCVNKLPPVPDSIEDGGDPITIADSKEGWAQGIRHYINGLYAGINRPCDLSLIRPKGARLKTFGGRASGPEPLRQLIDFLERIFKGASGRKLTSLECHDIACMIANIVVVGGVRRSACISLSDYSDDRLRHAKDGAFWEKYPHRGLSNNSIAYTEKPDAASFLREWESLIRSNSGERGIFNRDAAKFVVAQTGRRDPNHEFGCNPCSEIILRDKELCNLSEVIIRPTDTLDDLKRKVRMAAIIGTVQSTLTKFKFVSREWRKNCEEERLLGVSLTGLRDHPVLCKRSREAARWLVEMKQQAIYTAEEWSKALEIPMPAAVTCVKPSGTVSQLVDTASGLHPRYSPYYIRRIRISSTDPLCRLLIEQGVPHNAEVGYNVTNTPTWVFDFPVKAPESAVFRDETSAIEQLEYWLMLQKYYCEHKPSATVYVKDDEWVEVAHWVYKNWNYVSGIAFLPYDGGSYQLAPYEEITEEEYLELSSKMPAEIDYERLSAFEKEDNTTGAQEVACHGGACEL